MIWDWKGSQKRGDKLITCYFYYRYNFDSWREFSYLDEEEKEKAEWWATAHHSHPKYWTKFQAACSTFSFVCFFFFLSSCSRDERRWIEKQNRASRAQRKKEEMNRIRTLVGTVLQSKHTPQDFRKKILIKKLKISQNLHKPSRYTGMVCNTVYTSGVATKFHVGY